MSTTASQLGSVVGPDRLLASDAIAKRATSYWNGAPMQAKSLLLPRSTGEVSKLLNCCQRNRQTVVTHGGLTGCVSGAEATIEDVVLSLEKMNRIEEIDPVGGTAIIEAGAILQTVQETVADEGLYFPLDLGARGSCTIGGNVATNAGGINVLRYGMMRNLVLGLEAVMVDGTVISSMNRMLKNNAGYDVKQLFIGTEGTLGIVTKVVLRIFPQPASRHNALVAMKSFDDVTNFLLRLQQQLGGSLSAYEIMWGDYFEAVTGEGGHRPPLSRQYPFYVILQVEGGNPDADAKRFEEVLSQALDDELIADAVIPKSNAETGAIWRIREDFEPILAPEPIYLYDVSLPIRDMPSYVAKVKNNVINRWPDGRLHTFGHLADGNLHFFVQPFDEGDHHHASDECVYEPLLPIGGSVSAEHGIGTEKLRWLPHSRTAEEINLMRTMKRSLDPKNLLNPGRVLESVQ